MKGVSGYNWLKAKCYETRAGPMIYLLIFIAQMILYRVITTLFMNGTWVTTDSYAPAGMEQPRLITHTLHNETCDLDKLHSEL